MVVAFAAVGMAGCAAEPKKPQTVSEFIGLPRVGEELRP
jgi:hypothetical protein